MTSIYENRGQRLEILNSKAILYYKDKLVFKGDSKIAISTFVKNCDDENLRMKLEKYKYVNIWNRKTDLNTDLNPST